MELDLIDIQTIEAEWLTNKQLSLDVLRLDKIHPVVSGNKWFKLNRYLDEARMLGNSTLATFGGAWSNHIVATAYVAFSKGLQSVGIIRGEKPPVLSYSLNMAIQYGMEIHFVSRDQYREKGEIMKTFSQRNWYWIDEGGFGIPGALGAAEILKVVETSHYSHIIAAVGTGTMLAGLVLGSTATQKVIGICSMKGNYSLEKKIKELTGNDPELARFEIEHDYHFGGYGKHPVALLSFINEVYLSHHLPLDIIYTGKTFFAIKDMAEKNIFEAGNKLLMIHSGGLQGNKSLPEKVLAF